MHKFVGQHVVWVWVAMLGVLFSALAPGLSHAMPASGRLTEDVQVCTMAGMKTIAVDRQQAPAPGPAHPFEHCPYCALHGAAALPPPSTGLAFALPPSGDVHPPLFYRAARPLFAWRAANPRAPPLHD